MIGLRGLFTLFVASLMLVSCRHDTFPSIKDGDALRNDCIRLLEQFPQSEIPKAGWPRSVQALKPIRVTGRSNHIEILLHQEPGKFTGGYDVFADPQLSPSNQGVWVQKTAVKGVYIFKMPY
ncbi:MAG: hypothetical protein JWQ71_395 [Pedosphaera sp.]|nr:hypothetical protein [Pedosphaera sp.]